MAYFIFSDAGFYKSASLSCCNQTATCGIFAGFLSLYIGCDMFDFSAAPDARFYRRNGKIRFSGDWDELTAPKETVRKVYDAVQTLFGVQVARQVCNRLFIRGFPSSPILAVGSGLRSDDLARCVSLAGGDPAGLVCHPARLVQLAA